MIGAIACGVAVVVAGVLGYRRGLRERIPLGVADRVMVDTTPAPSGVVVVVAYVAFKGGGGLALRAAPGDRVTLDVRPPPLGWG